MKIEKINSVFGRVTFESNDLVERDLNKYVGFNKNMSEKTVYSHTPFEKAAALAFSDKYPEFNVKSLQSINSNKSDGSVDVVLKIAEDNRKDMFNKHNIEYAPKRRMSNSLSKSDKNNIVVNRDGFMKNVSFLNSKTACVSLPNSDFDGSELEVSRIAKSIGQYGNVTGYAIKRNDRTASLIINLAEDASEYLMKSAGDIKSLNTLNSVKNKVTDDGDFQDDYLSDKSDMSKLYDEFSPKSDDIESKEILAKTRSEFEKFSESVESSIKAKIAAGTLTAKQGADEFKKQLAAFAGFLDSSDSRDNQLLSNRKEKITPRSDESFNTELEQDDKEALDAFYNEFNPTPENFDKAITAMESVLVDRVASGSLTVKEASAAYTYLLNKFANGNGFLGFSDLNEPLTNEENERAKFLEKIPVDKKKDFSGAMSNIYKTTQDGPDREKAISDLVSEYQNYIPKEPQYVVVKNGDELLGYLEMNVGNDGAVDVTDVDGNSFYMKQILHKFYDNDITTVDDIKNLETAFQGKVTFEFTNSRPSEDFTFGYGEESRSVEDFNSVENTDDAFVDDFGNTTDYREQSLASLTSGVKSAELEDDGEWEIPSDAELLLTDAHGVYIPKLFADQFCEDPSRWGISDEDVNILASGPEAEYYWETWESVLNHAKITNPSNGKVYYLYQEGDLWAIPMNASDDKQASVKHANPALLAALPALSEALPTLLAALPALSEAAGAGAAGAGAAGAGAAGAGAAGTLGEAGTIMNAVDASNTLNGQQDASGANPMMNGNPGQMLQNGLQQVVASRKKPTA